MHMQYSLVVSLLIHHLPMRRGIWSLCGKERPSQNRGMGVSFQGAQAGSTLSLWVAPACLNRPAAAECASAASPMHGWREQGIKSSRGPGILVVAERGFLTQGLQCHPNRTVSLAKRVSENHLVVVWHPVGAEFLVSGRSGQTTK